jgi:regulator of protease activity HflC (stomatin/prohibitin superfamily)
VAAVLNAEGAKEAAIREAEGKLEASRLDAEAKMILADATREAISRVTAAIGDNQLPATYLLGEQYVKAMRDLSASGNAKTVVLPADVLQAVRGLLGK